MTNVSPSRLADSGSESGSWIDFRSDVSRSIVILLVGLALLSTGGRVAAFRGGKTLTATGVTRNMQKEDDIDYVTSRYGELIGREVKYLADCGHCLKRTQSPEQQLIDHLFTSYNPEGRPVLNKATVINVTIALFLLQINEVDEKSQILSTTGWVELDWSDELLRWNPDDFGNVTDIVVSASRIWLPDVALDNTATKVYDSSYKTDFRVSISYTGHVWWPPGGRFATSCQLDVSFYPFDDQNCQLSFTNWAFQGYQVDLNTKRDHIGIDHFTPNGEWNVISTKAYRTETFFDCCPHPFSKIHFELQLRRRSTFYLMNVLLPCLMISSLICMVFCLPPESGEKVSLGTTLLLSFSVFQLLIADNMPQTSQYIPVVSIYLTIFMAMTTLSIVLSVLILRVHHHGSLTPVPVWLKCFIFCFLAKVACVGEHREVRRKTRRNPPIAKSATSPERAWKFWRRSRKVVSRQRPTGASASRFQRSRRENGDILMSARIKHEQDSLSILNAIDRDVQAIREDETPLSSGISGLDTGLEPGDGETSCCRRLSRPGAATAVHRDSQLVLESGEMYPGALVDQQGYNNQLAQQIELEWKLVAKVLDRLFFYTFVFVMFTAAIAIAFKIKQAN